MTSSFDTDLFVIGGGSGGVRAARIAAGHGARVMLAEEKALGGTCVNVGCVPKKLMAMAAEYRRAMEDAAGFGWTLPQPPTHDWAALKRGRDAEIERLHGSYRRMLEAAGATILPARARLTGPQQVEIAGRRIRAERILLATGGTPFVPEDGGLRGLALTSDDMFALEARPQRIAIIGGGYIAVEFANILRGLGSAVCLVVREQLPLRGFDEDLRIAVAEALGRDGTDLHAGCTVAASRREGAEIALSLSDGREIRVDAVLAATGRRPLTAGLGLEAAGVAVRKDGSIAVDARCQSSVPSIFALGDVAGHLALTPVAIRHGHALADRLYGKAPPAPADLENVPTAVFSSPPLATCGMTEHRALAEGLGVTVYRTRFTPMRARMAGREETVTMKLIVDTASQRVLGCHMMGSDAPEILQGIALAVTAGLTKPQLDAVVGIHPTVAEEFVTMRTATVVHEPACLKEPA